MSKALKIIFTGSLLLNLVLIGAGVGAVYKKRAHFVPSSSAPVSTELRQKLKHSMKENRAKMRPVLKQMQERKKELRDILVAEKFDVEAYRKSVSHTLDLKDEIVRQRALSMEKILVDLPQVERQKLSRRLLRHLGEGRPPSSHRHQKARQSRD